MKKTIFSILIIIIVGLGAYFLVSLYGSPSQNISENPAPVAPVGKIDINVVCQGALAYTTFPDAAAADQFVQDCKDGKHPEVIEKFIADMGLGDGAAI